VVADEAVVAGAGVVVLLLHRLQHRVHRLLVAAAADPDLARAGELGLQVVALAPPVLAADVGGAGGVARAGAAGAIDEPAEDIAAGAVVGVVVAADDADVVAVGVDELGLHLGDEVGEAVDEGDLLVLHAAAIVDDEQQVDVPAALVALHD